MIKLRFVSERSPASMIIRWYSNGDFSHVDLALPPDPQNPKGSFLGARIRGGVQVRPYDYLKPVTEAWFGIELDPAKESKLYVLAHEQIGLPYDWRGIVAFALNEEWEAPNSFFCSMLIGWLFDQIGEPLLRLKHVDKLRPTDITTSLRLNPTEPWRILT